MIQTTRRTLFFAIVLLLTVPGCQPKNEYAPGPLPEVTVARPVQTEVVESTEFTGATEPIQQVDVRARVEGFLESIEFEEGNRVEKDQLLFTIDQRPFKAAMAQAEATRDLAQARLAAANAELARTEAEIANADAQRQRAERAASSGAMTAEELDLRRTTVLTATAARDGARATIESSEAEIAAADAAIEQATLDLNYTEVRSPIAGRAGRRLVDVGNLVGSGEPTLLTNVINLDSIYAFFTVSETEFLNYIKQEAAKSPDGAFDPSRGDRPKTKVFLALGDEDGFPHQGEIDYADQAVDQSTGTYQIRAKFPNSQAIIPAGAFVRINVPSEKITATLIDEQAIGRDQGGAFVLAVDETGTVQRRSVTLGGKFDGKQAISGELGPEDRIIVNGIQRARPGAKVTPIERATPVAENNPASADSEPATKPQ